MKTILAIETSTQACSVSVLHQGKTTQIFELLPQKHAQRVLPMIDEVLNTLGLSSEQIDFLAYGEGPGAFTGIRIAAGVIQGLALGWNKPVIGISSLEAMVYHKLIKRESEQACRPIKWAAMMDARMHEVYLQTGIYYPQDGQWQASEVCLLSEDQSKSQLQALTDLNAYQGYGDVREAYPKLCELFENWHDSLPTAESIALLASMKTETAKFIEDQVPLPLYLRNNVAETIEERRRNKAS
ncbi:MAG: tRNA (adenosine(37)-N6)-threonylcarbamoyltransferase complex dimerization subunit type 1 TsaB [Thiomicrorhabdus chilensis]|uniref:tRNA (adenosine(37)-N6)-threonylcarbamoyltransferase complex dimerization subunit type 1 TsaB n=1 Tax=Thiomicrorhabdus chilensis TaxID=63656 RepID=UPI00299D2E86|nr:tRNA (adenosine(37)-N6)-threonylcarbamoyltransferase complex dimerization subunit type 1 TsaB [Thiomicrorhabdus chilensis]MDX1348240.1 tRNA (adenosine(37)-N6)-threonylcarbamoyltransferase complex dimerization subunit type 1 TsaB [Thiomicrorhabdus chilensis]